MIRPFGETSLLVEVEGSDQALTLAASLEAASLPAVAEVVPGRSSLLVELDPRMADAATLTATAEAVARLVAALSSDPTEVVGRLRVVPVVYGGEHGPDLETVAELCAIAAMDVVAIHAAAELRVLFDGFAPGFAYLGELPPELRVARLHTPRTRTPAGSVAIAGSMSGIYPATLPGGWRVIGRTPLTLFDPRRGPPAYLVPGDRVRFEPIEATDWERRAGAPADW